MATAMIQIGGSLIAVGLLFAGIQGLRGKPDSQGKKTSPAVAWSCIALSILLAIGSILAPKMMFPNG